MPDPDFRDRDRLRPHRAYVPPGADALLHLDARACRWPIGEVESDDFAFCCAPAGHDTYCPAHRRLALRRRH